MKSGHGIREDDIREDGAMLSSVRHARHILDADVVSPSEADPDITAVRTAAELQAAIMQGVQDILIQDHLDLSDLNLAFNANRSRERTVLGEVKPSTRSIRVLSLDCCSTASRCLLACLIKRLHLVAGSQADVCHLH